MKSQSWSNGSFDYFHGVTSTWHIWQNLVENEEKWSTHRLNVNPAKGGFGGGGGHHYRFSESAAYKQPFSRCIALQTPDCGQGFTLNWLHMGYLLLRYCSSIYFESSHNSWLIVPSTWFDHLHVWCHRRFYYTIEMITFASTGFSLGVPLTFIPWQEISESIFWPFTAVLFLPCSGRG